MAKKRFNIVSCCERSAWKKSSHCERIKTHPSWTPLQPRDERDGRDAHDNDMAVSSYIPLSCHAAASSRRFGHLISLIVLEAQGTCPLCCNLARRDERRAAARAAPGAGGEHKRMPFWNQTTIFEFYPLEKLVQSADLRHGKSTFLFFASPQQYFYF